MEGSSANGGTRSPPIRHLPLFDCLISYHHTDVALVRSTCECLRKRGLSCWIDYDEINGGDDWRDRIPDALSRSTCVVIFFGPGTPGKWQMEEWRYLSHQCIETNKRFIPVTIAGATIPPDLSLATRIPIELKDDVIDPDILDRLVAAIRNRRGVRPNGEHLILVEVESLGPTCFVAVPLEGDREVFAVLKSAAEQAGLQVVQTVDGTDRSVFAPDPIRAIQSATVLIADCTRHPVTNQPDSNVMFQIGVARSVGKSVIAVTNSPIQPKSILNINPSAIVEFDPQELNTTGQLLDSLSTMIADRLSRQRAGLIEDGNEGIAVALRDVLHMQTAFWEDYEHLFSFGLKLNSSFREVSRFTHALKRAVEILYFDVTNIPPHGHLKRNRSDVQLALEEFVQVHHKHVVKLLEAAAVDWPVIGAAFKRMRRRSRERVSRLLENAQAYCDLLRGDVDGYQNACQPILDEVSCDANRDRDRTTHLRSQVDTLADYLDHIPVHSYEMMMRLLELMKNQPTTGDKRDDDRYPGTVAHAQSERTRRAP